MQDPYQIVKEYFNWVSANQRKSFDLLVYAALVRYVTPTQRTPSRPCHLEF